MISGKVCEDVNLHFLLKHSVHRLNRHLTLGEIDIFDHLLYRGIIPREVTYTSLAPLPENIGDLPDTLSLSGI